ncbi:hypothetical protein ARMGADRAFT_1111877 [Armillaria gallica]|uniref:Uncharacterized protein n=1 Tax=Armillaria gallica TaxID=47427 RepID=A0A2H3DGC5_ARMGA|nr:hypothetical protein ARMGADRAFT_1111877 [Armillaria gallica]
MIRAGVHGIYTGVVAVTLWAVGLYFSFLSDAHPSLRLLSLASINNFQSPGRPLFLIFIILLLYILAMFNLYKGWAVEIAYTTLPNGESFWTAFEYNPGTPFFLALGIDAMLSAILADAALAWDLIFIWRCWIVWGRSWRIVLVPILCTTLAAANVNPVSRSIVAYYSTFTPGEIVPVVLEAHNGLTASYIEELASAIRGIVPTILVGRVAPGHARPDDSWSYNSTESSIRFGNHSILQNDSPMSAERGRDTSFPNIQPNLEVGLEDGTELRVEEAAPSFSACDYSARVVGTSNSIDCSVV